MDIRILRHFIQVAREESISKAANKLHISQPALSRQMKELEDELQVQLFTRTNYAIRLTRDGVRLRLKAEDIVRMADQTVEEFTRKKEDAAGDIRIGAAEGEGVRILGKCMARIQKSYPDIFYHLYTGDTEMLKEKLDSGFLDFLAISENPDLSRYRSIQLPLPDQWGLVLPESDPLSKKEIITKEDLFTLPLIISRQALRQDLNLLFGEDAHRFRIAATYDLAHNSTLLVKEGFGYSLCFDHLADLSKESGLVFRPIFPALYTTMHFIYRKYQIFSTPAEIFLKTLTNMLEES